MVDHTMLFAPVWFATGAFIEVAKFGFDDADIHVFLNLHGIGTDDLTLITLRHIDDNRCLADTGRAADNDDFGLWRR